MEEKNEDKMNKIKKIRHTIVVYLTIAVITFCAIMLLYTQVLINAYIPSESMENTLMTGDRVIGNRLAYKFGHDPERFDSSEPLDDSFIREKMDDEPDMEFNVPEDSYFMLGDNRNSSADSRYWDYPYVPKEDIVAKASFRYWKGFKWVK